MQIRNINYQDLNAVDLLVFALGYETRSTYLYKKNKDTRNSKNTLAIWIDSEVCRENEVNALRKEDISVIKCDYADHKKVCESILEFLEENFETDKLLNVHIDYSSMPRSWYCLIPRYIKEHCNRKHTIFFWYTAGNYPTSYKAFPSAGIDSISVFSGSSLPAVDIKRYHIMGIGFDNIRTETVKSIVEPDSLIVCYAYKENSDIKGQVYEVNQRTIQTATMSVALPINHFSGMVDRICSLTYELLSKNAQVILIPDGPKPLIMSMSLVPEIIGKPGVTCLHISRNSDHYSKVDVAPQKDEIYGFQIKFTI